MANENLIPSHIDLDQAINNPDLYLLSIDWDCPHTLPSHTEIASWFSRNVRVKFDKKAPHKMAYVYA